MKRLWPLLCLLPATSFAQSCEGLRKPFNAVGVAIESRDFRRAEELLDSLSRQASSCPRFTVLTGRLSLAQGDYRLADSYSQQALIGAPEDAEALLLRAEVLDATGERAAARELLERACRSEPNLAPAHFQLGLALDRIKRSEEAAREFELAARLRPDDPRAYDYLALNLERIGEMEKAESAYLQGLRVNSGPRFDGFLDYNYGRLLLKLDRTAESATHLNRALELAPRVRAVHYDHAKLNLRLGKLAEARADAERGLSLPDPGRNILDLQLYNLLSGICARLGDTDAAQRYVDLSLHAAMPAHSRERD